MPECIDLDKEVVLARPAKASGVVTGGGLRSSSPTAQNERGKSAASKRAVRPRVGRQRPGARGNAIASLICFHQATLKEELQITILFAMGYEGITSPN